MLHEKKPAWFEICLERDSALEMIMFDMYI